ncbi:MAG: tRNA 5-methoxyuridine(34)/uridine 5-oxyacetic acid(34) synthase CmoB [Halomonadaceae bacterium]|nr:MAG: tRNA 5-methoxyuridine(34)/uridine 5-oxyacetic acid(34) synthase CmoB [Halomonadaceae bacterium]
MTAPLDWQRTYRDCLGWLEQQGKGQWVEDLRKQLEHRFITAPHGDLERWLTALRSLPAVPGITATLDQNTVNLDSTAALTNQQQQQARQALQALSPWRKGPFQLFGTEIDTEWRSDWKWQRIAPHLSSLQDRTVLDVGCGSGYHCWRMLGAGARRVLGIDPSPLFLMQFLSLKGYLETAPVDLLPLTMEALPARLELFDTVFSMGVLYHRRSPLDHLLELKGALRPGGELVLETLVIEGEEGQALMPEDRYGRMRNVWFIPTVATLERWLQRTGFTAIRCVDTAWTTPQEQRATQWMTYQSLKDFLDPQDSSKTIEGYSAPLRATLIARRPL